MKAADNAPDGLTGEMYRHSDRCSIRKTRVFQSDLLLKFESVNSLTIISALVPAQTLRCDISTLNRTFTPSRF